MPIRELFHVMTMVDDFDPAQTMIDALFDPVMMFGKSWSDFDKRWASISIAGADFPFELMEASKREEDAGSPLPKFARRFGDHLHSLAWYVDREDMADLVERFLDHGVRVVRPDGSLIAPDQLDDLPVTVFTHGRDTFGQMEFQARGGMRDPRFDDDFPDDRWRTGPLGLLRLQSTMVLVADLDRAMEVFVEVLGGRLVHETEDVSEGRADVLVGDDTMVELVHPKDEASQWGRELATNGELPNALTLLVSDLDAARRHVEGCGASIDAQTDDTFTTAPFGAMLHFTTARIPGDPRDG